MKTMGKVASPKLNDFDIVSSQLSDGLARLTEAGKNAKLSIEQQRAMDKAFEQIEMLRNATKDCGQTERFAEPVARNDSIRQTIAGYDHTMFDNFDYIMEPFGQHEMIIEQKVAGIDRDLAVHEMISNIRGSEDIADMDYNGY